MITLRDIQPATKLPFHGVVMPTITLTDDQRLAIGAPAGCSNLEFLTQFCRNAWQSKVAAVVDPAKHAEYGARVTMELDVINSLGFIDYLAMVYDICRFADEAGIPRGPGRGSVASSLVAYLLNITDVDPIETGLFFTRFLSKARAKKTVVDGVTYVDGGLVADIDMDFCYYRRGEVIDYVNRRYPGQTAKLLTTSTLTTKILLKDLVKAFEGAGEDVAKEVSALAADKNGVPVSVEESLFGDVKWQAGDHENGREPNEPFVKWTELHPEVRDLALSMEGLNSGEGVHASALAICATQIRDLIPLKRVTDKDGNLHVATGYDMYDAQELVLKFDLLGLKTLSVLHDCGQALGIDWRKIDVHDPCIYEALSDFQRRYGIFQLETFAQGTAAAKVKPRCFDELAAVVAIARPGAIAYLQNFADYVNEGRFTSVHPLIDDILRPTGGIAAYQEQLLQMLVRVGLTPDSAEGIRKIVGKKLREKIPEAKAQVAAKAKEGGHPDEVVELILKVLEDSGGYSFAKCIDPRSRVQTKRDHWGMLADVVAGDLIRAYDVDSGTDHYVQVLRVVESRSNLFYVRLANGLSLTCSMDHKLLCEDGVMRPLREVYDERRQVRTHFGLSGVHALSEQGEQPALDIEVAHPDHNFYADGLVVSNCHAVSYSRITAATLYLKTKHPLHFFWALLQMCRHESEKYEKLAVIRQEMAELGLDLLPPHFHHSELGFKIEGDNAIRFALGMVRGISDKNAERLDLFRAKAGEATNKFEVLQAARNAGLHIGLTCALIQAGCMEGYDSYTDADGQVYRSRSRLVLEACTWNVLTDAEKASAIEVGGLPEVNWDVLCAILHLNQVVKGPKGKPLLPDRRFATIKKRYEPYRAIYDQNSRNERLAAYYYERRTLGYSYSETISQIFSEHTDGLRTVAAAKRLPKGEVCRLIGFVGEKPERGKTSKGNAQFRFTLADETGTVTIRAFNERIDLIAEQNEGQLPAEDDLVICCVKCMGDGSFFAQQGPDGVVLGIQSIVVFTKLSELKDAAAKEAEKAERLAAAAASEASDTAGSATEDHQPAEQMQLQEAA